MSDEKDAAVVVDLRGTTQGKVVLHDIIASIGSTVYIRDGIIVYVKPPPASVEPIEHPAYLALRLNKHKSSRGEKSLTAPISNGNSANSQPPTSKWKKDKDGFTHFQRKLISLLQEQPIPRPLDWIAQTTDMKEPTVRSGLKVLIAQGIATKEEILNPVKGYEVPFYRIQKKTG